MLPISTSSKTLPSWGIRAVLAAQEEHSRLGRWFYCCDRLVYILQYSGQFVIISYLKEQYLEFYVVLTAQIAYSFSVSVLLWCRWLTVETEPQYTFSRHHDCFIAPEHRKYSFLVFQSKQAQMYQRCRKATQKKTTHLIRKIIQQRLVWCLLCAVKDLYILEIYAQITLYKT